MKVAASHALATVIPDDELGHEYVIPGVFNREVCPRVAAAVAEAAERDGVARKAPRVADYRDGPGGARPGLVTRAEGARHS